MILEAKIIKTKPKVSYFQGNDATQYYQQIQPKMTEVNIIRTRKLTPDFCAWCVANKSKVFLHIVISGMGKTQFEPNIPTVKIIFQYIKLLIEKGFPQKQILIIIDPVVPNNNGLKALQLLLKVFTEFKDLRLRFVRINLLKYRKILDSDKSKVYNKYTEKQKYIISNNNILRRFELKSVSNFIQNDSNFFKDFFILRKKYESIISIDHETEPLIGVRELIPFGYNNSWHYPDGTMDKIIHYENGNKFKPVIEKLNSTYRCSNKCILCPFRS